MPKPAASWPTTQNLMKDVRFVGVFRVLKPQGFGAEILPLEELNMYFLRPRDVVVKLALKFYKTCATRRFWRASCLP